MSHLTLYTLARQPPDSDFNAAVMIIFEHLRKLSLSPYTIKPNVGDYNRPRHHSE